MAEDVPAHLKKEFDKYSKSKNAAVSARHPAPASYWPYFDIVVLENEQKLGLKCKAIGCERVLLLSNPSQQMPRHFGGKLCSADGRNTLKELMASSAGSTSGSTLVTAADLSRGAADLAELQKLSSGNVSSGNIAKHFISPAVATKVQQAITNLFYECPGSIAFRVIEDPAFREIFDPLGLRLPSRKSLAGRYLEEAYEKAKEDKALLLEGCKFLQGFADSWKRKGVNASFSVFTTTAAGSGLDGTTLVDLAFTEGESLTSEVHCGYFKASLLNMCDGDTKRVAALTVDMAAPSIGGARLLVQEEGFEHVIVFGCQAHGLSLAIKDILKGDDTASTIAAKAHKCIAFVHNTPPARLELRTVQVEEYDKTKALRLGVETRFATTVLELRDVAANKKALQKLAMADSLQVTFEKAREGSEAAVFYDSVRDRLFWRELDECLGILGPIADLIYNVEGDFAGFSQMLPVWKRVLEVAKEWCGMYRSEQEAASIMDRLRKRFNKNYVPAMALAYILDLRFYVKQGTTLVPNLDLLTASEINDATDELRRLAGPDADDALLELAKLRAYGTKAQEAFNLLKSEKDNTGVVRCASAKATRAVWEGVLGHAGGDFPKLAPVAAKLLTLHATSASSERIWSQLRWVYADNRLRLGTQKARKLLFVSCQKRLRRRLEESDMTDADVLLEALLEEEA